ncbi:hypothetical protein QUF74_13040 [Candidatus Halobeggiatoa sp. HSG11]|nr:hypothetical protein [Candidatus Halobeggiatoa sp. HSG11]
MIDLIIWIIGGIIAIIIGIIAIIGFIAIIANIISAIPVALDLYEKHKNAKFVKGVRNKYIKSKDTIKNLKDKVPNKFKKNSPLTSEERQKLSQEFNQNQSIFIAGPPVRYGNFFDREEIIQNLFNLWKSFPMQNAAIYGEKRIGKTSLLLHLKDMVDNPNDYHFRKEQKTDYLYNSEKYCFIYVNFQDVEYHSPKKLLEYILLKMKLEKAESLDLSLHEENPLLGFGQIVSDHLVKPTVILMDEIGVVLERHSDKFDNEFWEGLRAIATTKLDPQCLGFVLASHQHPTELAKETKTSSPFFNVFSHTEELRIFTEQEAKRLIANSPEPFSENDVKFILEQSQLKPYILQILCQRCLQAKNGTNWQSEAKKEINKIKSGLNHE